MLTVLAYFLSDLLQKFEFMFSAVYSSKQNIVSTGC